MGRTAALWHFDEITPVLPSDTIGNVEDLAAATGLTTPVRIDGIVGGARQWSSTQGLSGLERVADSTLLRRSMAIEAIAYVVGDGTRTLVQRGAGTGAATERMLFALKLIVSGGGITGALQMAWQKSNGSGATVPSLTFQLPSGGWIYVGAARRWISATSVEVDYWVNDRLIGTVTSTDGDIEDGVGGRILVGATNSGGSIVTGMLSGDAIDELRVSNTERAAEEFAQAFTRCFIVPGYGRELVQSLLPPGDVYSRNPDSVIQGELGVEGDALSLAWSKLEELAEFFLPDRASATLERWETVTGIQPRPTDGIQTRRNRVLGHLRTVHGFSRDKIKDALAEVLGCTVSDLSVIEHRNRFADDFLGSVLDPHWLPVLHGGGAAVASGMLTLSFSAANDQRWETSQDKAVLVRGAVIAQRRAEIIGRINAATGLLNTNDIAGVFFQDNLIATADALIFGIRFTNPGLDFVSRRIVSGIATTTLHASAPGSGPWWVRILATDAGNFELQYSTVSDVGPWVPTATVAALPSYFYAGLCLIGGPSVPASGSSVAFDASSIWTPFSRMVFLWYVLRNAGTATPDFDAARQIIQRIKPAHTLGFVAGTVFLCDDALSLTDNGPTDVLGM